VNILQDGGTQSPLTGGGERESIGGIVRNAYSYRALVGKPEGKIPLGGPRRRWVDNIKINIR
jgi:hypothetical protein